MWCGVVVGVVVVVVVVVATCWTGLTVSCSRIFGKGEALGQDCLIQYRGPRNYTATGGCACCAVSCGGLHLFRVAVPFITTPPVVSTATCHFPTHVIY